MSIPKGTNTLKSVDFSGESGIMKLDSSITLSTYVNSNDKLHHYAKKITPIEGYEDIVIHGDAHGFTIKDLDGIETTNYTPRQFAEVLKEDPNYKGGAIRLVSCEAGKGENCAAQLLANQMNVDVLAPSDIVKVDMDGNLSVGKRNDGRWILFKPRGGIQ